MVFHPRWVPSCPIGYTDCPTVSSSPGYVCSGLLFVIGFPPLWEFHNQALVVYVLWMDLVRVFADLIRLLQRFRDRAADSISPTRLEVPPRFLPEWRDIQCVFCECSLRHVIPTDLAYIV